MRVDKRKFVWEFSQLSCPSQARVCLRVSWTLVSWSNKNKSCMRVILFSFGRSCESIHAQLIQTLFIAGDTHKAVFQTYLTKNELELIDPRLIRTDRVSETKIYIRYAGEFWLASPWCCELLISSGKSNFHWWASINSRWSCWRNVQRGIGGRLFYWYMLV